jgi:hypothetical protein
MATIRLICPDCGPVEREHTDVVARLCLDNDSGAARSRCPTCGFFFINQLDGAGFAKLIVLDVKREEWRLPLELKEPRPGGNPFTEVAIDLFMKGIEKGEANWFRQLEARVKNDL